MAEISKILASLNLAPSLIASKSGLTLERVHQLLQQASVSSAELRALATGLKLPLRTLTATSNSKTPIGAVRFRSTQPIDRFDPTKQYLDSFIEAAFAILPNRDAPPHWAVSLWDKPHRSLDDAFSSAASLRNIMCREQKAEPATRLPQILNLIDGVILSQLPQSKFEGASLILNNYIFIFVSPRFSGRMLFTLAHELGHIVAHHTLDAWHCDMAGDIGRFRRSEEGYADAFASAFLLPPEGVGQLLSAVRKHFNIGADEVGDVEILYLSRFFGVSFEVAARRCEFLGLLPPGGAFSIAERLREDFKSAEQRANQLNIPPLKKINIDRISPALIKAAAAYIYEGTISLTWLAERLHISVEQFQQEHARLRGLEGVAH